MTKLEEQFAKEFPVLLASGALTGSFADFADQPSKNIETRGEQFLAWRQNRMKCGVWPFSTTIRCAPAPEVTITNQVGQMRSGLNFASQDYLGLSAHPMIREAATEAIREYGPHSASAPVLQGNSTVSLLLEQAIADALKMDFVVLFPTGWAAGFGAITGLMRNTDHVVLDQYAHNCTVRGALAATPNVRRVPHLSTEGFAQQLHRIRAVDNENAILVVTEGIFSMDADTPDIPALQAVCKEYESTLLVDIAHDFGSCGPGGSGTLGSQDMLGKVDLVVGSFSKVFASNGGFVATRSETVKEYLRPYAPCYTFSNAISPLQCATVLAALQIIQSVEGDDLRRKLVEVVHCLRDALQSSGLRCLGKPGPVVPAFLGPEGVGRITAALCFEAGLFANLVEFPAVAVDASRFRMQVMASHTNAQAERAAHIIADAYRFAKELFADHGMSLT